MLTGLVGMLLPLLPTTPFVLLAAYCFSRGSTRYEQWLLAHPRFGPMVRDWRGQHAVPLRAKQLAWIMMASSSVLAGWWLPRGGGLDSRRLLHFGGHLAVALANSHAPQLKKNR